MSDYNDGKWHQWDGKSGRPETVSRLSKVLIAHLGTGEPTVNSDSGPAGEYVWHNVIAFCVTQEHKEAREFWVFENGHGDLIASGSYRLNAIHVREVLE